MLALGVLVLASKDLLLEVGHTLKHSNDYLTGKIKVHSHKFGDQIVIHHNHQLLDKIEKAFEQVEKSNSEDLLQNAQILTLDQIKLILQDNTKLTSKSGISNCDYYYLLQANQEYISLLSRPPRFIAV